MTTAVEIAQGIIILANYTNKTNFVTAEHGVIYANVSYNLASGRDAEKLNRLGWFQDEETGNYATYV